MKRNMFRKRLTRAGFEHLLGGTFVPAKGHPSKRINGKWSTWTGPSKQVQGRPAKFAQESGGHTLEGRKWLDIARQLGLNKTGESNG